MKKFVAVIPAAVLALSLLGAEKKAAKKKDDGPQPVMVDPGGPNKAPSDAIVLFDGRDLSQWVQSDGQPAEWTVQKGVMVCKTGTGDLHSKVKFRSAQIHLEFNVPLMPDRTGQARGNSGVMMHQRGTEIQILDSLNNPTYGDGSCGGLYGIAPPLVNAWRRPGEWQTYDIVYHTTRCEGSDLKQPGTLTLFRNGVLVQDGVKVTPRGGCLEEGPLVLQDHNGFQGKRVPPGAQLKAPITPIQFRNIWLRKIAD